MLPDAQHAPTATAKCACHEPVASLVGRKLSPPEGTVVDRKVRVPWAAVPETAIDEDREPLLGKDEIRTDAKRHSLSALGRGPG